ncbi:hypothetical protein [Vibrio crassostreae]|uniref:hypothetical protein n=1 Tax=Vibrio crassostreae TaxID=246167 RepID=UPI002E18DF27|nr:hypothetical protein [Vibrio crassostreae]
MPDTTFPITINEMLNHEQCWAMLQRYRLHKPTSEPLDKFFVHCIAVRFLIYSKGRYGSRTVPGYHSIVIAVRRAISSSVFQIENDFPPSIKSLDLLAAEICLYLQKDRRYTVKESLISRFLIDMYGFSTIEEMTSFSSIYNQIKQKTLKPRILTSLIEKSSSWARLTQVRQFDSSGIPIRLQRYREDGRSYCTINILSPQANYLCMPYRFSSERYALEVLTAYFIAKYGENKWKHVVEYELAARKFESMEETLSE